MVRLVLEACGVYDVSREMAGCEASPNRNRLTGICGCGCDLMLSCDWSTPGCGSVTCVSHCGFGSACQCSGFSQRYGEQAYDDATYTLECAGVRWSAHDFAGGNVMIDDLRLRHGFGMMTALEFRRSFFGWWDTGGWWLELDPRALRSFLSTSQGRYIAPGERTWRWLNGLSVCDSDGGTAARPRGIAPRRWHGPDCSALSQASTVSNADGVNASWTGPTGTWTLEFGFHPSAQPQGRPNGIAMLSPVQPARLGMPPVLRGQRLCHGSLCLAHCPLRCKQTKLMEQRVSSLGRLMLSGMGVTMARDARGLRLCAETTTRMAMVAGRIGFNLPRERHFCHTATEPVQGSQIRRHHQQGCPAMGGESVVINGQRSRRRRSLNRCSIGGEDQGCWCLCLPSFFWVFFRSVLEPVAGNRTGRRGVSHPPPASVRACPIFH